MSLGREVALFLFLVVIGLVLGRLQTSAKSQGRADFVSGFVQGATSGPSNVLGSSMDAANDFFEGALRSGTLKRRNRELEGLSAIVGIYQESVSRLERELAGLRKLSTFPEVPGRVKVPAAIVSLFPREYRIGISVGSTQGVRPGMAVVAAEGLLGVVQTVSPQRSQVTLIYSPTLRIGAVAERNPPPAGLLKGDSTDRLVLEFFDIQVAAKSGDLVTTSGFSDKIPGGIPIGRIVQVEKDERYGACHALVFPNVQVGAVREVYVLK